MNSIYKKLGRTGLFGIEILSKDLVEWDTTPIQGVVVPVGTIDGIRIFEFIKDDSANTWMSVDDKVVSGGVQLCKLGVPAQEVLGLNMLSKEAVVINYSDRGRVATQTTIVGGKPLLALIPKAS